jgi:hypothetical protein
MGLTGLRARQGVLAVIRKRKNNKKREQVYFSQQLFLSSKRLFQKVSQAVGKSFLKGIIDPFFMIYYALAAKAMSFAIDLRAGAILINLFTNRAVNYFIFHKKLSLMSFKTLSP